MADDEIDGGASAPCFAHLLVDGHPVDPDTARDVARFRRAQRTRLIAARAMPPEEREQKIATLVAGLDAIVGAEVGSRIAVYWPIRDEPDLRGWMRGLDAAGARVLLPVGLELDAPLEFHAWSPQSRMTRGLWNIPVPADGHAERPDIVIAPLVGVDRKLHRLGNGGGYYDRTLARLDPRPRLVGVGFAECRLPTIYPMPWDIPMDTVILSDGTQMHR